MANEKSQNDEDDGNEKLDPVAHEKFLNAMALIAALMVVIAILILAAHSLPPGGAK